MSHIGFFRILLATKFHSSRRRILSMALKRYMVFVLLAAMLTLSVPQPILAALLQTGVWRATDLVRHAEATISKSVRSPRSQGRGQSRGMPPAPVNPPGSKPDQPASRFERENRVASLRINTSESVVLESRQPLLFMATPLDAQGGAIHGLKAAWESSDKQVIFINKAGQAIAGKPGTATLTATSGSVSQVIRVQVVEGSKEPFGGNKKQNSRRQPRQTGRNSAPALPPAADSEFALNRHHVSAADRLIKMIGANTRTTAMMPLRDPNEDPLPDDETNSLYEPPNNVGLPRGKTRPGGATPAVATEGTETGNKNFSFGIPIVTLPGRGIDCSLELSYNSLLYNKSVDPEDATTYLTYDVDSGWPAPGFRIGYGQLEAQGSFGFTLTDPDGTRHALSPIGGSNYETHDGSFIKFTGGSGWGTVFYTDGSRVSYGAAGGGYRSYPTQITDSNGNYILISYVNGVGPRISQIQDTLERFVTFSYAANGDLTSISAPALTGSQSNREVMRFFYEDLSLNTAGLFTGVAVTKPASAHILKYIFLSNSVEANSAHIGYRYDYSNYGMIYQSVEFRGMVLNSGATGISSEGTQAAVTTYNYPGTPINTTTGLSDAPTFTTRTDDWAGRTTGGNPPSYSFTVNETTGVATVTSPDGTVNETHTIVHANNWDHGLVSDTYLQYGSTPTVLAHVKIEWEQGASGSPRVSQIRSTDVPGGLTRAIVFTYTTYDNEAVASERDFTTDGTVSATELRRTETTYITSSGYTNRYVVRLPASVKVFSGGSSTPASRVDYAYDDYGVDHRNLTGRDDIIMHDPAYDPFQQTQETNCRWECFDWEFHKCYDWEWVCDYVNLYDPTTDYRGNVTSVTTYSDAANTGSAIVHATTYDIAGNVMTAQVDCCQVKSFTYSGAGPNGNHDYAYPISESRGSGGTTLTTGVEWDYNTGLVVSNTDENNQVTTNYYNADSLRLEHVEYADGGITNVDYSDGLVADVTGKSHFYISTSTKLDAPGGNERWVDSVRYFDGRSNLTRTFANNTSADGWSTRDIEYDAMGRAFRVSNPYFSSGYLTGGVNPEGFWSTNTYDNLGRITQVTMPRGDNDNQLTTTAQVEYAGVFTTVTDQAGKKRRQKLDALGRVVRLDEPDSAGSLGTTSSPNLATSYEYDALGNLIHIAQPGPNSVTQHRYFMYDSLSRLIRDRQVEHATNSSYNLSDPLTGISSWSRKFEYNSQSLLTDGYDPRGVHVQFSYDGLNRLTQTSYSDATPTAHYYYDSQTLPSGAPSYDHGYAAGRLLATTYGAPTATTGSYFGYDQAGRLVTQKQVTGSNTYSLTYTYNFAGLLTSETYPSARIVSYSYDEGARLSQVRDTTTIFANGFEYSPHGGLKAETWGNGAVHSIDYNKRMQPNEIKLKQSAAANATVLQRYIYSYGQVTQSTGSVDTSKNNGQVGRIDSYIDGTQQWDQRFSYDELGRLSTAAEYQTSNGNKAWQTQYTYDRWGNRFQSGNGNSGVNYTSVIASEIDAATNRFIATGATPTTYDAAGNITTDSKFRGMNYSYDANGRQTLGELINHTNQQTAVYDAAGLRVQTTVNSVTRTMVYDQFGQQVADYNGTTLQRENIYRGGQLLSVVETPMAAAPSGLSATPNSGGTNVSLSWSTASGASAYRVERKGAGSTFLLLGTTTSNSLNDAGVSAGNAYLYRVCAADTQGYCTSTYSNLALGSAISFPTDPTITGMGDDPSGLTVTTIKAAHITELRTAVNAVRSLAGLSAATWTYPNLAAGDTIRADDVRDLRTKLDEALVALAIQTASYTDPTLATGQNGTPVKKAHVTELRSRSSSGSGTSGSGNGGGGGVMYVLADAQSSSRAVMNNNGSGISTIDARHDYLPFGEELGSGMGSRNGAQGYGTGDTNRRRYAQLERDTDTGLDHTWFRKYESLAGRWTSPDPYTGSMSTADPQSLNRYSYVQNDPVNQVDPSGLLKALCFAQPVGDGLYNLFCFVFPPTFVPYEGKPRGGGGQLKPKPQTARECRAAALQKLAEAIKARSDYYPSDAAKVWNIVSKAASAGGSGAGVGGPVGALGGVAGGAFVAVVQNGLGDVKVEAPAVAQFSQDIKACNKKAKQEAAEAKANGNSVEAAPAQQFVVTKAHGVFAIYPFTVSHVTLLGDYVIEEHTGNGTLDHVRKYHSDKPAP